MARRKNFIELRFDGIAALAEEIDRKGGELHKIVGDALERAAETVQADTTEALDHAYLPAHGKFSRGATAEAVVKNPKANWSGEVVEVPLGFDKGMRGAGGWLITGTPKMKPDPKLQDIYGRKTYERKINNQIQQDLANALKEIGGS